ncbi:hypothetical protein BH20ACT16_BH20ACT16_00910 [soil metagenome]
MRGFFTIAGAIADRQHGRVSIAQLLAAGIDARRVERWLRDGRLRGVHTGVYAVGHAARSVDGDYMAAVLAGGSGAALSHRAAGYRLGLVRGPAPAPEITVPTLAHRRRPGIVIHRVATLDPRDVFVLDRIPITIVPRVLIDLAPSTAPDELARMCHEAWVRHRTRPDHVECCIARNPRKPGVRKLRLALSADVLLSELERGFLELLRRHGLPIPRTNIDHHGDKVDCHWPLLGLTIELLSYRFHASRQAFELDVARRRRSNHVAYTYGDVFERGAETIADLRPRLGQTAC